MANAPIGMAGADNLRQQRDEMLDALKEINVAFRDDGSHLERMAALAN